MSFPEQSRLQIAHVIESCGGSGRHVSDLSRGLVELGHSVSLVFSPSRAEQKFVDEVKNIRGLRVHELPMQRSIGFKDFSDFRRLKQLLRQFGDLDILHAHSSKAGGLVRMMPNSVPGARVYTPHAFRSMDPVLRRSWRRTYATLERFLSFRTDKTIAVGMQEFMHARSLGIPSERIDIVVHGLGPNLIADRQLARAKFGICDDTICVGFAGRLTSQKDPIRFVRAINIARRQNERIVGIVLGDGPLRCVAEQASEPGAVRFLGWCDAPNLMVGFDAFVMTSQYEAMPYTLLEALNAQLPILVTNVGGATETVIDNINGKILPDDAQPEEFAYHIVSLAENENQRAEWAAGSRSMAKRFTMERMVNQTISVYRNAILDKKENSRTLLIKGSSGFRPNYRKA